MDFGTRFAVLTLDIIPFCAGITVTTTTNKAVHKWLKWTDYPIRLHLQQMLRRGVFWLKDPYYCFVVWHEIEQEEAGDTLTHTFIWPNWSHNQSRRYLFYGYEGGNLSPSTFGIYEYTFTGAFDRRHFVPDPAPGVTCMDAFTARSVVFSTWEQIRGLTGTTVSEAWEATGIGLSCQSGGLWWSSMGRTMLLFDTSIIPVGAQIVYATLKLKCASKTNDFSYDFSIGVYGCFPASNVDIENADYLKYYTQIGSNVWKLSEIEVDKTLNFTLGEHGRTLIVPGGITKLALREARYDAQDQEPVKESNKIMSLTFYMADKVDEPDPVLTVQWMC